MISIEQELEALRRRCETAGYGAKPSDISRHFNSSKLAKEYIEKLHLHIGKNFSLHFFLETLKHQYENALPPVQFGNARARTFRQTQLDYLSCNCERKVPLCDCGQGVFRKKRDYSKSRKSRKAKECHTVEF